MRCFYVLKKWSPTKLSLNRDLSLNKMSLNWDCTVCPGIYGGYSGKERFNGRYYAGKFLSSHK